MFNRQNLVFRFRISILRSNATYVIEERKMDKFFFFSKT
jgi:hypothetical protein